FDIGGHSLLAVQVISRLRQLLSVEVPLSELFAKPVLADFAQALAGMQQASLPAITAAKRDAKIPLSFAQQRLWFLAQLGEHVSRAYHMPMGLRLVGPLDTQALRHSLDQLVARHEALRTTFESVNDEPSQVIADVASSQFDLIEHDFTDLINQDDALDTLRIEEAHAAFDLHRGPLIRGRLITLRDDEHVLLITQHHILSDGWSLGVLVNELSALYAGYKKGNLHPLAPLTVQYADYALWQRRWLTDAALQRQADYWKSTLTGAPALLELPTDRPRPAEQNYVGDLIEFNLGADLTRGIKALCQQHGTTMFMTLLASWSVLMARLSGQNDVVIGTPTANRNYHEVEGLIGFFVNALALRIDLSNAPTVETLLAQVKEKALAALQHQDIPFEQVVELIQPERSLSHNPLFQIVFAWQNAPSGQLQLEELTLMPLARMGHATSIFDLSLHLWDAEDTITGA
ncbi:MAG: condensation domain-containing protein, partial [Arenimonas sp.]